MLLFDVTTADKVSETQAYLVALHPIYKTELLQISPNTKFLAKNKYHSDRRKVFTPNLVG